VAAGHGQLAVRAGTVLVPRLGRGGAGVLAVPQAGAWRLGMTARGSLDGLVLAPCPQADGPLGAGQVRIAVRAAGLNFRDVMVGLGLVGDESAVLGSEAAGIVTQTGPGVTGLAPGDKVTGIMEGGFGPAAVADWRLLAKIPAGWTFARAASVPVAFATAWYGLGDLAGLRPGEKVLVHAAAGGVGMAAVQIAARLGATVYATASPGKHRAVAALGVPPERIASSRTLDFARQFSGAGITVVLNSLAGEYADASLGLLGPGGRFIEMGKTDIRDAAAVAAAFPGVAYRAFDLAEAGPERMGQLLNQAMALIGAGELAPLPVTAWDVRRAPQAFRYLSQARHTGKIVLTIPRPPDPAGTVLVTGGTGTLAGHVARRLAAAGQARLLLASRRGPAAPGAAALAAALAGAGAEAAIAACDITVPAALAGLLAAVPAAAPLTAVIHAAGVLDDATIDTLSPRQLERTWAPKAAAAALLHEATAACDLAAFVLFSSTAGLAGGPGQGNYAAANTYLDALAARRRAQGLPGLSLAWGLWAQPSGMTGHLTATDLHRAARSGMTPLTASRALALLDLALTREPALQIPAAINTTALATLATNGTLPPMYHDLIGTVPRPSAAMVGPSHSQQVAGQQFAGLNPEQQREALIRLVRGHAAVVLGHLAPEAIQDDRAFKDMGFDSLTAVELRNRLQTATGLSLPASLVFDYPNPAELAGFLARALQPPREEITVQAELDRLDGVIRGISPDDIAGSRIVARLQGMLARVVNKQELAQAADDVQSATDDELFEIIGTEFGIS
jgi:NADPH:quinone reductase-like Zn-dependent oxidoreductase